jgi:HK97 family phage major capsid protein
MARHQIPHMEYKDAPSVPSAEEFKTLADKLGTAFEEFKKANEESGKKRDAVTEEKIGRLDKTITELSEAKDKWNADFKAAQDRADDLEKKFNRPGGPSEKKAEEQEVELKTFNDHRASVAAASGRVAPPVNLEAMMGYKSVYRRALTADPRALSGDEIKALQVGVQPDGGYLVPADTTGRIVTRVFETSPIRQIAAVQSISGTELKGVVDRDQAGAIQWGSETTAPTDSTTPQIGEWSISVNEGRVMPKATQQILEDASIDIEAWLARKVADKIARGENDTFVNGTGVGRPRGFTTYTTAATADATRTWGQMEHIATGVNGDFAASAAADHLFDLLGAFNPRYLNNARFVTRREVITKIRKFKGATTGDYLWQPGLQSGAPDRILGYPIVIAMDMPALATGSLSLAFGDFSEGYQIVDRIGMSTLRDPFSSKPYVLFYTRVRLGGDVIDFDAIKFLKFGS